MWLVGLFVYARQIVKVSTGDIVGASEVDGTMSNLPFYLKNKTRAFQGEKLGSSISLLSSSTGLDLIAFVAR